MKKLFLLLMFAASAFGQTTTSVSGTVRDLSNAAVTSGQVSFTLQPGIDTSMSGITRFTPTEIDCSITGTGAVKALDGVSTCTVVNNTAQQPSGTSYKVCIQPQFVSPGSCFVWYATGGSVDITQQVPTPPLTPAYNLVDTFSNQTIAGNKTFTGITSFSAAQTLAQINKSIWVDGTKYPITQTGIQAAFTDACAISGGPGPGTDVYLPPLSVTLSNSSGQQFLITCNLHIHGAGDYATQFVVAGGVASTVPEFRFQPNNVAAQSDILIEGIEVVGNTSGGDAFFFDGTNTGMTGPNNFVIRKTRVHALSAGAWAVNGSGNVSGLTQNGWNIIENNTFLHGINLGPTWAVDSWLVLHNVFGSDVGNTTPCVNASTANNGASHITLLANNGGCNGGFFISHGTHECKILYNQIEQPGTSVETNSAIIDLIGDTFSIDQCEIRGNNIGSNNFATNGIRVGTASGTIIKGNTIGVKSATGVGIVLAAASSGTIMDASNSVVGIGGGAVAMTNATGVNPFTVTLPNHTGLLPATILNDTIGGIQLLTNGGKSWDFQNTSNLATPSGVGISFDGATSGFISVLAPSIAGSNTITWPAQTGTPTVSVGAIDQTGLTAAQATTTLNTGTLPAGQYLFSWNAKITTAGTTNTLGPMTLTYTDPDGVTITTVVSATQAAGGITVSGATSTTTSTFLIGTPLMINVKAGTNVQVAFGYASTGTVMQYNLHEKLVAF